MPWIGQLLSPLGAGWSSWDWLLMGLALVVGLNIGIVLGAAWHYSAARRRGMRGGREGGLRLPWED